MLKGIRSLLDAETLVKNSVPAAGVSAVTPSLGLDSVPLPEAVQLRLAVEALPVLKDGETVTVTIQDSLDGVLWANAANLSPLILTGAGGVGAPAATLNHRAPLTLRQYVRASAVASAASGDNTAAMFSLELAF